MLQNITIGINFIGLIAAIWMGVYLVTHGSRRPETWFSALALWSAGGLFLNQLLALLSPPAPPPEIRIWLYHLMLFWPRDVFEIGWKGWLLGWLPAYSIIFFYHATLYMLPSPFTRKRLLGALSGYGVVLASILIQTHYRDAWMAQFKDPLFTPSLTFPFFALSAVGFVVFASLSIFNLSRTARFAPKAIPPSVFRMFVYALSLIGAAGLLGILSGLVGVPIPQALPALLVLVALVLAGVVASGYYTLLDFQPAFSPKPGIKSFHPDNRRLPNQLRNFYDLAKSRDSGAVIMKHSPLRDDPTLPNGEPYTAEFGQRPLPGNVSVRDVELALRNLNNYAYLANSPLSKLSLVRQQLKSLETEPDTSIGRGKAVSAVLSDTVRLLKPSPEDVPNSPQRSWYPFIILWDAYVENKPNLEIMSRLYISEGTFNRTRKAAICSVAQLLGEMEAKSMVSSARN